MNYIQTLKELRDKVPPGNWSADPDYAEGQLIAALGNSLTLWLELAEALEKIDLKTIPCDPIFQEDCPSCNLKQALAKLKGETE